MRWFSHLGLRARLSLLVLLTLIPAVGLTVHNAAEQRGLAVEGANKESLQQIRAASSDYDQLIDGTRQLLGGLAQLPAVTQEDPVACQRLLANLLKGFPYYTGLVAATAHGDVFCSAVPLSAPLNISDRSYFQRVLQTHDFSVGDYALGRITGKALLLLGYPVLDADNQVRAVVGAGLDLSWLSRLASQTELPQDSVFIVTDRDGTILARYPEPDQWVGKPWPMAGLAQSVLRQQPEGTAEAISQDGIPRLYAFARLGETGEAGQLYVAAGIPREAALADAEKMLARNLVALGVVALLAIGVGLLGGELLVLRPMRTLIAATKDVGKGDLSVRTNLGHGREELSQLARAFDDMADALESREQERQRLQQDLEEQREHYRALVENSADAISLVVGTTRVFVNRAFLAIHGLDDRSQVEGHPLDKYVLPEDRPLVRERAAARQRGEPVPKLNEYRIRRPDGEVRVVETSAVAVTYKGQPAALSVARDITARKQAEEELVHLATHDPLTDLLNRRRLQEELDRQVALAARYGRPGALLFLDLDNFKYLNDTLGHQTGDETLRDLAGVIRSCLRETDTLARLGGDEFIVLAPETDAMGAEAIAHRILDAVGAYATRVGDRSIPLSVSIGITLFPQPGRQSQELLIQADLALRQAKEKGRNRVEFYSRGDDRQLRQLGLEHRLREALVHDQFVLFYQPIVELGTGQVAQYELLLRLRNGGGRMLSPAAFLSSAERFGLTGQIDRWVIGQAINFLVHRQQNETGPCLAVNLSARSLGDPELLRTVEAELVSSGVNPAHLVFEITETAAIANMERARRFITHLKALGCRFSLDDFGTAFSSLYNLKHLPVDFVKIDGNFIKGLTHDATDQHLVTAIVGLAEMLGKKTIAEGVEDELTLHAVRSYHIDYAQGFCLGRPRRVVHGSRLGSPRVLTVGSAS